MITPRHMPEEGKAVTTSKRCPNNIGVVVKSDLQSNESAENGGNSHFIKENMKFQQKIEEKISEVRKTAANASPIDLAYMAGFFDGEGSVVAWKAFKGNHKSPSITVKVGNTDIRPVQMFVKYFGPFSIQKAVLAPSGKTMFFFNIGESRSRVILERLMPYLVIKKRQAKIALEFYKLKATLSPRQFQHTDKLFELRDKVAELNSRNHLLN